MAYDVEEVSIIGKAQKPRRRLTATLPVDFTHSINQMLHDEAPVFVRVQRQVRVLEDIHIKVHRVAAPVCLEDSYHRRGCRGRKVSIDEKLPCLGLLKADAGPECSKFLVCRPRPVTGPPPLGSDINAD